jgi:hypothetical protein
MTAATIVIHACDERTGWLEGLTGSHGTLDELIRLASFGVDARLGSRRGLRDHDGLVRGRAVLLRGLGSTVMRRFRLGHQTGLGKGERGHDNEEHDTQCVSFHLVLLQDSIRVC